MKLRFWFRHFGKNETFKWIISFGVLLNSCKLTIFLFAAGSQPASERHCSLGKPSCPEPAPREGAGAKRSEYEAAAGAAAEAAAPGESAETTSGDRDAAENAQSQGHCDTQQLKLRVNFCTAS